MAQNAKTYLLGTGVEMTVDQTAKKLTLEIDLSQEYGPTGTGASEMIASTGSYQLIPGFPGLKVTAMVIKPYPKVKEK